jgi:hypothetical protein
MPRKDEMPSTSGDTEIGAIEQVIHALEPLDDAARERVLDYAFKRLGITESASLSAPEKPLEPNISPPVVPPSQSPATDIRSLREEKQPKSANDMAAIVGYYLAELAPETERKTEIGTSDIEKYFKQAQHRLPEAPGKTLPNAAAAGYFDSASRGLYTLNPVGHNLVAHGLPRGASPAQPRKRRPSGKAKANKPEPKAKASSGSGRSRKTKR